MNEHRDTMRMRRLKDAKLVFNERKSVMNCTVKNVSETGAKIIVEEPFLVPAEFEFCLSGGRPKMARKVWFKNNEMGIEFY